MSVQQKSLFIPCRPVYANSYTVLYRYDMYRTTVASIPIPGGRSLHPVKNKVGKF